jgi:ATP-dependent RNA helicase RhlE
MPTGTRRASGRGRSSTSTRTTSRTPVVKDTAAAVVAATPTEAPAVPPAVESNGAEAEATLTFEQLALDPRIQRAVRDAGYTTPTPIQRESIPLALAGRDLIGLAQTGTGKTASFTLPLIQRLLDGPRRTRALVLTPTRELALQVEESVRKYAKHAGIDVAPIFGGMAYEPQEAALRRGVDIVVATPGRLLDHLERQNLVPDDLEVLVLDEADRMLDMGFAPQINRVVSQIPKYRQTLLFSATMPPEVEALARKYLRRPVVVGRRSSAAITVAHAVYPVPAEKKTDLLLHLLKKPEMDTVLVFTRTKHGADRVVRNLEKHGVQSTAMHADKTQAQRIKALEGFRDGSIRVLVATDIAQRGLDINGITHVINYDVPQQPEDYVHRIGRTGRAAATGDAVTFMAPDEIAMVRTIERVIGQQIERVSVPGFDFGTSA